MFASGMSDSSTVPPSSCPGQDEKLVEPGQTAASSDEYYGLKAGLFLSISAGFGLLGGFGTALASAKKQGWKYL